MIKLDVCPFCGGRTNYSRIPKQGFSLLCSNCGAIAVLRDSSTQDALGTAWNRRTIRHNFSLHDKIKPCPFCSFRVDSSRIETDNSILKCGNCGMMISFVTSNDILTTYQNWNRRTAK